MNNKAFTLIETLIAVTLLSIAIVGPLVTASRALLAAYIARDQLTASYLAQEGVEYIRIMRDDMYLADYKTNQSNPTPDSNLAVDAFCDFFDPAPATDCSAAMQPQNANASIGLCYGSGANAGNGSTYCALADPVQPMGIKSGTYDDSLALYLCGTAPCGSMGTVAFISTAGHQRYAYQGGTGTFTRNIQFYCGSGWKDLQVQVTVTWNEHGVPYTTSISDTLSPWE